MKQHTTSICMARFWRSIATAVLTLLFFPLTSEGQPILEGSYEDIVIVRPLDCPDCTPSQRNLLENGVQLLRTRLARETVSNDASVCITSAGLARDMTVLTFEAYRSGDITLSRWHEYIKARAKIAGGISTTTMNLLLDRYRDEIWNELGADLPPSQQGLFPRLTEIFGAAQFSRLFEELDRNNWNLQSWQDTLLANSIGFNPVVDELLSTSGQQRQVLDRHVLSSSFQHTWQQGQLWHLARLPGDFEVATLPQLRDALRQAYDDAVTHDLATVMQSGCASEAAAALRAEALRRSEGLAVRPGGDKQQAVEGENQPDGVIDAGMGTTIEVIDSPLGIAPIGPGNTPGRNPGCACGGFPGSQGGQGGTAGNLGGGQSGGGENPGTGTDQECSPTVAVRVLVSARAGESCQPIPSNCHLSDEDMSNVRAALGGAFPTACPSDTSPPVTDPGPPILGPADPRFSERVRARCQFECGQRGGEYTGFSVSGSTSFPLSLGFSVTCNCR